MPVNKVLLPVNNVSDFAPGGSSIGWVEMNETTTLIDVADNIISDGNAGKLGDHAIPSPIAHIKHFKHRLDHGEEEAVMEWQGMLAAIALQDVKSLGISVKAIPLFPDPNTGNPTAFGKVLYEELVSNSNITGYYEEQKDPSSPKVPNYKTLMVFCKDDVPFAMFMPSMLICPFKYYPIDLFSGLQWYDEKNRFVGDPNKDPKGTWLAIRDKITGDKVNELEITAKKLFFWIKNITESFNPKFAVNFEKYILGECSNPDPHPDLLPVPCDYGAAGSALPQHLKMKCPFIEIPGGPFTSKVLFILPQKDLFDGKDTETGKDYTIDRNVTKPSIATPLKRSFLGHGKDDAPIYVLPPFSSSLINLIRNGTVELTGWKFESVEGKYKCELKIKIFATDEMAEYVHVYNSADITWTETMPYISMWPYVNFSDDSWKEHYVAVWADNEGMGGDLNKYSNFISSTAERQHLLGRKSNQPGYSSCPEIKVSLISKGDRASISTYKCTSELKKKEFTLISSDSQPYALRFSYDHSGETYELGNWIIDRGEPAPDVNAHAGKNYYVAMDFGTTSTNVYLRENAERADARSISSAGKFIHSIYNPYVHKTYDGKCESGDSDFIQKYYLFSNSYAEMGKIFTYGQNFSTTKDGVNVGGTISNASGRMVAVDEDFILNSKKNGDGGIWNGLKMKRDATPDILAATKNFVCNALTYAVLEAKAEGVTSINLMVSYPRADLGAVIKNIIGPICNDLKAKSNLEIKTFGSTEAYAAGKYFSTSSKLQDAQRPTAAYGYAILDIGGGTTDFSFWKDDNGGKNPELKSEFSFGYAGNYLVERTIIQGIRSSSAFNQMWEYNTELTECVEVKAFNRYNDISVNLPIGSEPNGDFYQKVATIDFLLERCSINAAMLNSPDYINFLSAIRMKYYSLFTLVASYINKQADKGIISISPISFRICLAGCGSKGLDFARMGPNGVNFDNNVTDLFNAYLGLSPNTFKLVSPVTNNKEEVVVGLTYVTNGVSLDGAGVANNAQPAAGGLGNIINGATPVPAAGGLGGIVHGATPTVPATEATEPDPATEVDPHEEPIDENAALIASVEEFKETYNKLVDILMYLELPHDENGYAFGDGTSLVEKISCRKNPVADAYFYSIFGSVDDQTKKTNPGTETYADTFALFMLENMIDNFIN